MNELLAQRYWPGQDPIGKRFRLDNSAGPWVEIVGVAKTSKYSFIIERPIEFVYLPYRQRPPQSRCSCWSDRWAIRRVSSTPLREVVRGLDANLPISNTRTHGGALSDAQCRHPQRHRQPHRRDGHDGAGVGARRPLRPGGVCGQPADQRDRDPHGDRRRPRPTSCGWCCGRAWGSPSPGSASVCWRAWARPARCAAIFAGGPGGDGRTDFMAFLLVGATVLAVTLLAAYLPARRASRVNPTEALRHE